MSHQPPASGSAHPTPELAAVQNATSAHSRPFSASSARAKLSAQNVRIEYEVRRAAAPFVAVDGVDLDVHDGQVATLVGPSGCGKTSFLYAIAGLLPISSGTIWLDDQPIRGPKPDRGVVFQDATLMPWRSVVGNVRLGLELQRKLSRSEIKERVENIIELVGLSGFENAYPHELSGGMQQRVNLARALVYEPKLLLMDEPFAALDAQIREQMQVELLRVLAVVGTTCLFVTHDIAEAAFLGDIVAVFGRGRPGRIREVVNIDVPRPRSRREEDNELHAYARHIWELLHSDATSA
jgi:NitT/TauT family transport system ATP-binding protein